MTRLSTMMFIKWKNELKKQLHIGEAECIELLKMDYEDVMTKYGGEIMSEQMARLAEVNKEYPVVHMKLDQGAMFNTLETVYFYKRSHHLITQRFEWDDSIPIDTRVFEKLDRDVVIDTIDDDGDPLVIRVVHRTYPFFVKDMRLDWSISIFGGGPVMTYFHTRCMENVNKVFIQRSGGYCGECTTCNCSSNAELLLRPKHRPSCQINDDYHSDIFSLLYTAVRAIDAYVNRTVVVKKIKSNPDKEIVRNIMVARDDPNGSERVLPLVDYVYEYKESQRKEWQGGHHAAPCSHERKGYFRKAKRGNYIRKDGEFIEVPKGTGNFIRVRPTKVNWQNDEVQKIII